MTRIHLLPSSSMHWGQRHLLLQQRGHFRLLEKDPTNPSHLNRQWDIEDRLNFFVDDGVILSDPWATWHQPRFDNFIHRATHVDIHDIGLGIFFWINSAARARLSSSLPKSWIDTGFSPFIDMEHVNVHCRLDSLWSETISITTSPAPALKYGPQWRTKT